MEKKREEMKTIMIGCGNSRKGVYYSEMSEHMYKEGFEDMLNIDISDVVISQMNEHYKEMCPKMKCK